MYTNKIKVKLMLINIYMEVSWRYHEQVSSYRADTI